MSAADAAAEAADGLDDWCVDATSAKSVVLEPDCDRDALRMDTVVPLMASYGLELKYVSRRSGKLQFVTA